MTTTRFCSACGAPVVEREIDHYMRSLCTSCGKILYRNPVPATGCIVEQHECGDDVEETARREVREETGLVVELGPLFGVYSYFDDPRQDGIIILYRASVVDGALEAGDDAAEVAFFAADRLPPPDEIGFESHRQALREWRDEVLHGRVAP